LTPKMISKPKESEKEMVTRFQELLAKEVDKVLKGSNAMKPPQPVVKQKPVLEEEAPLLNLNKIT